MNRRMKAKKELEQQISEHQPTQNDCPTCGTHFSCPISREAHFKRYPLHQKKAQP